MTSLIAAREAMYQAFVAGWGTTSAYTFDNEDFDPPDSSPWVRFSIRHFTGNQETLGGVGNRKFQRSGSVFIQVFTLQDTGVRQNDTLTQTARAIFEGVKLSGTTIRFLDANVAETGPDGKWYQTVVEVNFQYDETK